MAGWPFARMTNVRQESVAAPAGFTYSVGGDASSRGRTLPTMVRHGPIVAQPILTRLSMASPCATVALVKRSADAIG
jgi:hypothetical protein